MLKVTEEIPGLWILALGSQSLKGNEQAFFTCPLQTLASLAIVMGKHMELSQFVFPLSQRAFIYCC